MSRARYGMRRDVPDACGAGPGLTMPCMLDARAVLIRCHQAATAAADPETALRAALRAHPLQLQPGGRLIVVGAGKATAPMAVAMEAEYGDRIHAGVIVVKTDHGLPLSRIQQHEGAHPVPDAAGAAGAAAVLAAVRDLRPEDLVVALISGGASALLPVPVPGVSLPDKQQVNRLLLASGLPIESMNAVRKHLSLIKGGQLARAAAPARVEAFILSDVIGDDLSAIASGPTAADATTFADVQTLCDQAGITAQLPASVRDYIAKGCAGTVVETPKPNDPCFATVRNHVIGSNALAVQAAVAEARAAGCHVDIITEPIVGEATAAAELFVRRLITFSAGHSGPCVLIGGGETTVTLGDNPGLGGRSQEFALACALKLSGHDRLMILAAGTDGTDGPTDAAGGFASGTSLDRAEHLGVTLADALRRHDAYPALAALKDLYQTGPTRTNVMDVVIGIAV